MNQRFDCTTCANADTVLESYITDLPIEISHHRVKQQVLKCGFGSQGVCCRLCANGPCRITPESPLGVCGANADTFVARNFLRSVAAGSGCYIHVLENAARSLRDAAISGKKMKGSKALGILCDKLGISGGSEAARCMTIADVVLADLNLPEYEKMNLIKRMAYAPRNRLWEKIGILPGGAKDEVFSGIIKTSTNLSSDPVDMMMACLRLGISTGIYGLTIINYINDILLGEPEIRLASVGMHVIDLDYINIMVTGHQHAMVVHLQDYLTEPDIVAKAQAAGAKGFKFVGCTCIGQDMQMRGAHYSEIYSGHAGNNFTSEAILATGAIDAVISDFNCTLPGIESICEQLSIKQICLDVVSKKANAELKAFSYNHRVRISDEIVNDIIESYTARRNNVKTQLPDNHGNNNTLTGVSEVTLKEALGDSWDVLIQLIKSGNIKGIVAMVGCSNLVVGGHDILSVELTKELIARDILVLTAGCSTGGIQNCGLMTPEAMKLAGAKLQEVCQKLHIPPVLNFGPCLSIGRIEIVVSELAEALNIDLPQLPVALSAAQWLEEQALADVVYGLALGLPTHLGSSPFISGSNLVTKFLGEDMKSLTGGQLVICADAIESANILENIILEKRTALGL